MNWTSHHRVVLVAAMLVGLPALAVAALPYWSGNTIHLSGDFNGDGRTDVLMWQTDGTNDVVLSNGAGSFTAVYRPNGLGAMGWWNSNTAHVVGDFNGDGNTDVLKWQTDGNNDLLLGTGNAGTFSTTHQPAGIGAWKWWAGNTYFLSGDYDGDGRTDVLVWQTDGNTHLHLSNGDGTFAATSSPAGIGATKWWAGNTAFVTGDFNGDGRTDVLVWQTDGNTHLHLSNGDGTFTATWSPAGIGATKWWADHTSFLTGDFNGDGRTDVLVWQADGYAHLHLSNGNGTFTFTSPAGIAGVTWTAPMWLWPFTKSQTVLLAADFTADGKTDVLVWESSGKTHLHRSNGDGTFTNQPSPSGIGSTPWLANNSVFVVGDFNGDGRSGVLVWQSDGYKHLHIGNRDGTFTPVAPTGF